MKHYKEINKEQHQLGSAYRKSSPDTMNAFIALHKSVMKDDEVLALKYREMIALGRRCCSNQGTIPQFGDLIS